MNLMKNTTRKILFLGILISITFLLFPVTGPASVEAQTDSKTVLFINSYHPGYKFSDDITNAIVSAFQEQGNINLRIEYLDTKRIDSQEYLEEVYTLFQTKYANADLDLVMSSDDAALNFLFKYADSLFPDVPVVFAGANFFDPTRLEGYDRFTGVSEEVDLAGTLDLALSLHPDVNTVVVVNDTSVTGQRIHETLAGLIPQYPDITFQFLEDQTMDQVRQKVGALPENSLVFLTLFFRDSAGGFYEYDQFTTLITESSSVPVYGTWDYSLGYGIVGGKLTSGTTEGQRAAALALRVLNGENPRDIPVEKQAQSTYMFDYTVLQKWGIPVSSLPKDSVIINRPVSFYEENKGIIWGVIAGFIVLVFIIVILTISNNQRRLAQAELAVSNRELQTMQVSLEERVTARTEALATVAEVSAATSTILETDKLLQQVVDLSKERFKLYHAHIYLLNDAGDTLVLTSGAGEAGRQMVAEGRSILLSKEQSLVARAARERKGVTVNDVTLEPDFLPHPLLPDTRSELAVPMIVGETVIGVFDVQSDVVGRFTEADIDIQTTLASQIAAAVQNARSYSEAWSAQQLTRTVIDSTEDQVYVKDRAHRYVLANERYVKLLNTSVDAIVGKNDLELGVPEELVKGNAEKGIRGFWADEDLVFETKEIRVAPNETAVVDGVARVFEARQIPLKDVKGHVWAVLNFARDITERKQAEEFLRHRASQQEALNSITQKIQSATNVEAALKIAARELGQTLGKETGVALGDVRPDAQD